MHSKSFSEFWLILLQSSLHGLVFHKFENLTKINLSSHLFKSNKLIQTIKSIPHTYTRNPHTSLLLYAPTPIYIEQSSMQPKKSIYQHNRFYTISPLATYTSLEDSQTISLLILTEKPYQPLAKLYHKNPTNRGWSNPTPTASLEEHQLLH